MSPRLRLWLARTAAWTLLFTGWLGLGALALQHGPAGWAQFAPQALWLATVALAQPLLARRAPGAVALRTALLLAALATAAAVLAAHWAAAAVAWGLLLVVASNAVRALRATAAQQPSAAAPDSPRGAALAGALLAAVLAGDPRAWAAAPALAAALPLGLSVLLALLLPFTASARPGCGSGLFDCALGLGGAAAGADAPWRRLAALAMLPMMASLPAMAELCRAEPLLGALGPQTAVALHLLAMLLPAWWRPAQVPGPTDARWRTVLPVPLWLLAGGAAVLAWPGTTGLMLGMGLQAMAWGWVWRETLAPRARLAGAQLPARRAAPGWARFAPAVVVMALGAGLAAAPWAPAVALSLPPLLLGASALLALSARVLAATAPTPR